jgi:hypothetical protein
MEFVLLMLLKKLVRLSLSYFKVAFGLFLFFWYSGQTFCQTELGQIVFSLDKINTNQVIHNFFISRFMQAGLKPLPNFGGYESVFFLTEHNITGTANIISGKKRYSYNIGKDFFFSNLSATDTLSAEMVFIGYGENLVKKIKTNHLENKAVIALSSLRGFDSTTTRWILDNRHNNPEKLKDFHIKAFISVLPKDYNITYPNYSLNISNSKEIIYMFISQDMFKDIVGQKLIHKSEEKILGKKLNKIHEIKNKKISLATWDQQKTDTCVNFVGIKSGKTDQVLVIGAHFDIVNNRGANDNHSGVAMLIEVATMIKSNEYNNSIIFVLFDAEERGLYGSKNFLSSYPFDTSKIKIMINLDMVGKLNGDTLFYEKTRDKKNLETIFKAAQSCDHRLELVESSLGLSDSYTFSLNKIPTIYLSTGYDSLQHTNIDTPDKLNYLGMEHIRDYLIKLIKELDQK